LQVLKHRGAIHQACIARSLGERTENKRGGEQDGSDDWARE
jgi:hypothetical protein